MDADSIERRAKGPATGVVYVEFGSVAFPEKRWSDFALEFFGDYLKAVLKLRKSKTSRVAFFEGPFELKFRRAGTQVRIAALERGRELHVATVGYTELLGHSLQALVPYVEHEQAVGAG